MNRMVIDMLPRFVKLNSPQNLQCFFSVMCAVFSIVYALTFLGPFNPYYHANSLNSQTIYSVSVYK